MEESSTRLSGCHVGLLALVAAGALAVTNALGGCGLGYIDLEPDLVVQFQIENAAPGTVEVTVTTTSSQRATDSARGDSSVELLTNDTLVRVQSGQVTRGSVSCGQMLTISAVAASSSGTPVELTGDGTGTAGFDSGSVGLTGERFLLTGVHFNCSDTVLVRLTTSDAGELIVVSEGASPPDPIANVGEVADGADEPTSTGADPTDASQVTFRLENATATAADVTITPLDSGGDGDGGGGGSSGGAETIVTGPVRVLPGQFTSGSIDCGQTFQVTATIVDDAGSMVTLTGAGTGTAGFDSASVGVNGERLLVFADDYNCGETVSIRITDDGSGIGLSTGQAALGAINVFSAGTVVPEPDLPDVDALDSELPDEQVTLVVANETESTVQIKFAIGDGSLAGGDGLGVISEIEVRVPPGASSQGVDACPQEYVLSATHIESTSSLAEESGVNLHGVVLTGDGTGTEGFDSNSLAVSGGRLLQLGTHFICGDTITVTVNRTNNQIQLDDEGQVVVDEFGNPTIKYNVGVGTVSVTTGGG